MFDHVGIRVSDLERSRRFYELATEQLGFGEPVEGDGFVEWYDVSIAQAHEDRPVTRGLHLALLAESRPAVDEWWRVLTDTGYRDDGEPGPRPQYSPTYYGAFVLDPDGNSVEAVEPGVEKPGPNHVDHLWIRVRDVDAAKSFYSAIAPALGLRLTTEVPGRVHFASAHRSFGLVTDERRATENLHLAFAAADNATVDEFHRAALAAGYRDNGAPGERGYHAGYYGAFVLDPDGNNVEAVCHNR